MATPPELMERTQTVLLCDDDAMLRSVIGQMSSEVGLDVIAESEDPETALEDALRLHPDVIVLDLALRGGEGEQVLARVRSELPHTRVVVFSAYVANPMHLIDAGADAVVDKPHFDRLEEALRSVVEGPHHHDQRRNPPRELHALPQPVGLSLSGFEPWSSFESAIESLVPGDALLVFDVHATGLQSGLWDSVFDLDFRLAVARAAVQTRRVQDRVSIHPATGLPVMAVIAGHVEAPTAVFDRISKQWDREVATGLPIAAFGHVSAARSGLDVLDLAVQRVLGRSFGIDAPLAIV